MKRGFSTFFEGKKRITASFDSYNYDDDDGENSNLLVMKKNRKKK